MSWSWLKGGRSQLATPSGAGSQTLTHCHLWVSQKLNPTGPQALQTTQIGMGEESGPTDWDPGRLQLPFCHRDRDEGEVHYCLKSWANASQWPWWGLWNSAGHRPQSVPWSSQLTHWPKAKEQAGGGGAQQKARIQLLHPSPPHNDLSTAIGWVTSLTIPHWQLVAFGWGPLWHQPITKQDLFPVRCRVGTHRNGCMLKAAFTILYFHQT